MDKLRGMETFIAVVECGSYRGGVAPGAVGGDGWEIYRPAGKASWRRVCWSVTPDARASPTPGESGLD